MACCPVAIDEAVKVADPATPSVTVPSTVAPSENTRVPVGGLLPPFDTVAKKVTESNASEGFSLEESTTVVACMTFCASTGEVLGRLFASPPYNAMIECGPGVRPDTTNVATPDAFRFVAPSAAVPS